MSKITTILWDLDGTLVDSEYIHDEAVVHAVKIMGWNFDITNMPPGLDGLAVFELIYGEPLGENNQDVYIKWYKTAMKYALDNFHKAHKIPQTIELVHEFARLGLMQSIVSNSTSKIIHQCMEQLEIGHYFSNFIGRDNVSRGKPAPDPYLKAMQLHKVFAEECLVFEDSYTGMQAATKAGIKVIGVGDHARDLPIVIDHICSLKKQSWLEEIKGKYL